MKKLKALVLAMATVVSFTACGGEDNNTNEGSDPAVDNGSAEVETTDGDFSGKTLRVAGLDGGYGTAGWEAVIENFEEMTGAEVESQFEKNIY